MKQNNRIQIRKALPLLPLVSYFLSHLFCSADPALSNYTLQGWKLLWVSLGFFFCYKGGGRGRLLMEEYQSVRLDEALRLLLTVGKLDQAACGD